MRRTRPSIPPAASTLRRVRPVIGLTTKPVPVENSLGEVESHVLTRTYTDSVLRAGGVPLLLLPVPTPAIEGLLDRIDGLVLTGGGDVSPHRYGEETSETVRGVDFDRDEFELELVHAARKRSLPVLAICRGHQVVNVALGGTLIQDIALAIGSMDHDQVGHLAWEGHQHVKIEPASLLCDIVGDSELMVNSIHHQAIDRLAPGLTPVAWAADGVIEAVQHDDVHWPLLSVQWHPEVLGDRDDAASFRLFSAFVETARAAAGG